MNKQECDILKILVKHPYVSQRALSEASCYSLGVVNRSVNKLKSEGYLDPKERLTEKALNELQTKSPRNAIILAAGFGLRMIPINTERPKALIEVNGEILIERIIQQLHENHIFDISIVVGFMKEKFDYLIEKFGIELIVNEEYASKNNLHSLNLASHHMSNTYIVPCDIWCRNNPFHKHELYSWYMVKNEENIKSEVRVNRKEELVSVPMNVPGNTMVGIAYVTEDVSVRLREKLALYDNDILYHNCFWEKILYDNHKMMVYANVIGAAEALEINTYEQLRSIDENSEHLKSDAIRIIAKVFDVPEFEIVDITTLKKGMTNRSFLFTCKGKKYIMRIPGEGTDRLINRRQEASVYQAIRKYNICDDIVYINPDNGYKITRFVDHARVCNAKNIQDLRACMKKLREFHDLNLHVEHEFNIVEQINFYESLWDGQPSVFCDYASTKKNVIMLQKYIDAQKIQNCLTHIDAVPDNFLFAPKQDGSEEVRLIDWEYAGMQDPHVDIAMFCIYALYDRAHIDGLIDIYFENNCPNETRIKIYCYISMCGLLWSNWCEYKRNLGIEFGAYSLRQYGYAKEYFKIATKEMEKTGFKYE